MRGARPDRPDQPLGELPGLLDLVAVVTGTSGQVFRARQPALAREVAVTVFDAAAVDPHARLRFERELAVSRRLPAHPALLTVVGDGLTGDGHPYLLTTWCAGGSLAALVGRGGGPVPVATALDVGVRMGHALAHLHDHGLVHGGVGPERVLLDGKGRAVLAGLGGAAPGPTAPRLTGERRLHAAPEVLAARPATAASDVWSLASTLVVALTGRPPYASSRAGGPLVRDPDGVDAPPPPLVRPDVPVALSRLLRRSLALRPECRPTAPELAAALRDVQAALGLAPTDVPRSAAAPLAAAPVPRLRPRPPVRGRLATTALALGGAALGAAIGLGVLGGGHALADDESVGRTSVVAP